jgi:hypothetical protein
MQQILGNQGVLGRLQAKLAINQPGDVYEQEADRVAEQVMGMPARATARTVTPAISVVQRKCSCEGSSSQCVKCQQEKEQMLQRSGSTPANQQCAPPIVADVLRSPGHPMDGVTRTFMERSFDRDFSNVRVHADSIAAQSARDINALAYTVGRAMVFGTGQYAPHTSEGRKLIAHELTHVVQQSSGAAAGTIQRQVPEHSGPSNPLAGVPTEKWSEIIEHQYRLRGDSLRADAIRDCRNQGGAACVRLLSVNEVLKLWALGQSAKGDRDKVEVGLAGAAPLLARELPKAGPALRLVPQPPVPPPAPGPAVAPAVISEGAITAGGLTAIAVMVVVEVYLLSELAAFESELRAKGFIILESPLALCVGGCHIPSPPTAPPNFKGPEKLPPEVIKEWLEQQPAPAPQPVPAPAPQPVPAPAPETQRRQPACPFPTGLTPAEAIPMVWNKVIADDYYPKSITLKGVNYDRDDPHNPKAGPLGEPIGVSKQFWPRVGKRFQLIPEHGREVSRRYVAVLRRYGFDWSGLEADHVQDLQWAGQDIFANLWPMDASANKSAGARQNQIQTVSFCVSRQGPPRVDISIQQMKNEGHFGRWFIIRSIER